MARYRRSRFGLLLAAFGMFGHLVLMVPASIGWLVCLRLVTGLPLKNTPSPSTPLDWCVSGLMCLLSAHAAHLVLAETRTFESFSRSQERFRCFCMTALAFAPILLASLTVEPYPVFHAPSASTLAAAILLGVCWFGLGWLRFRQIGVAPVAS